MLTTVTRENKTMYTVIDLLRDQGIEQGLEKGIEKGRQEGRLEGRQEGRQEGRLEGRQEGRLEGRQEGRLEGRQEDIEKLLLKSVLSPEEIASVLEVDRAWVEEIARKVAEKK